MSLRVLISGASVAGPALAYWLKRTGIACTITIVERAPYLRTAGQGIDIRDAARDVVKRMGIFDEMKKRGSQEAGATVVDADDKVFARFPVDLSGEGNSPTADIEILRGELSKILYDVTKEDATYVFDEMVTKIEETEKGTKVFFANGMPTNTFDLVVAADGIGSKIRGMALGKDATTIKSLNAYTAYFSVPRGSTDSDWSRIHWLNHGRVLAIRPDNIGRMRPFLLFHGPESDVRLARCRQAAKEGEAAQKALFAELFKDGDWETHRFIEGMLASDDFYMQHIAQVKLDRWSNGGVTVLGDAGYAPSPFAGAGTTIAFIASYVLAGEISKHPGNIPAALESYERILRPYAEATQKLPYGVPGIFLPQSNTGVSMLNALTWTISTVAATPLATIGAKFLNWFTSIWGGEGDFKLPEYEAFNKKGK